jgi:hypothetical protein
LIKNVNLFFYTPISRQRLISSYNATILNIIYQNLIAEDVAKSVIDNFMRISPVAWEHISFTGRYNFTKDNSIVDLEKIVKLLEEKLRKDSKQKI